MLAPYPNLYPIHPIGLWSYSTVTNLGDGRQERRQHSPSGSWTTWERDFKNNIFKNRILLATLGFLFYFDSDMVMRTKMGCDNMVSIYDAPSSEHECSCLLGPLSIM